MKELTEVLTQNPSTSEFAVYIWPAYAIAALVLVYLGVTSVIALKNNQKAAAQLQGNRHDET
ncbi:MAG: heme exporter protein CcmD [Rickettsiales bacterium]|nr:heme exporter protein CcmD [Rickettsiales bacterium]